MLSDGSPEYPGEPISIPVSTSITAPYLWFPNGSTAQPSAYGVIWMVFV